MQVVGLFSGMMQESVNMSLKISTHSGIKENLLLFLDVCSKFYRRFVLVHLDYKVIQFTYTNFTTSAGHGLPICRKR
jgi:hypothetical protein